MKNTLQKLGVDESAESHAIVMKNITIEAKYGGTACPQRHSDEKHHYRSKIRQNRLLCYAIVMKNITMEAKYGGNACPATP
ncbi:hypothetical protein [Paenibacillus sp. Soil750]|uniref:hypothetical protein n=1 Tax=Paenibacillus sp. Soil750 TaxID=1736398 RepID=UPI00138F70F9|nr:hypothetical protein [Paenibacillus sp. Soil750]